MEEQHGFIFTFEGQDFKLRKSSVYECWVNGKFEFGFSGKLSFHNHLYSQMLKYVFGSKGFGSVEDMLNIHFKSLNEFLKFLELYGEDWK